MIQLRREPTRCDPSAYSRWHLYQLCWDGVLPAEVLDTKERGRLVSDLWGHGWTDAEIAAHTLMTTYTTARIRAQLGLAVRTNEKEIA